MAGDTRLTDGQYGINTRYAPKVWDVGDNIVLTANGYMADADTLAKRIAQKIEVFPHPPTSQFSFTTFDVWIVVSSCSQPVYFNFLVGKNDAGTALWKEILPLLCVYDYRRIGCRWKGSCVFV